MPVCIGADALAELSSKYKDARSLCDSITDAVAQTCNTDHFRLVKVEALLRVCPPTAVWGAPPP